jgi:rhamnulokinase
MYGLNGLQVLPFTTIVQLAVHDRDELDRAERLLWLPELVVHALTGVTATEHTSAGCSGLVDLTTHTWSPELCDLAGVGPHLLGAIEAAGRVVGAWRDVPVVLVGGHDTASAVIGMGRSSPGGSAYVSSGTWMLVGAERAAPDTSAWAYDRNFANEAGVFGGVRFQRNVTGLWILEQCRPHWDANDVGALVAAAAALDPDAHNPPIPVVDVDDECLRAPGDMLGAYAELAGISRSSDAALVVRSIVESIAWKTASVVRELDDVVDVDDVVLFGGGARIALLRERLAAHCGRLVRVGSPEATALGNAMTQGVALGIFEDLDHARGAIGSGSVQR